VAAIVVFDRGRSRRGCAGSVLRSERLQERPVLPPRTRRRPEAVGDGEKDRSFACGSIDGGVPTIRDLAVKKKGGDWIAVATNVTPEYRVVAGFRRMSNQQLEPLVGLFGAALRRRSSPHK
jgi:hypothetical protein